MKRNVVVFQLLMAWTIASPVGSTRAQAPAKETTVSNLPRYDVSTVRINTKVEGGMGITTREASFKAENVSFKWLFASVFGVREQLIFGLPPWAESTHYDIDAKVVDPNKDAMEKLTGEQHRRMLQVLLEDRFQLKWHFETRVLPAYELVVGKSGSRIKPAAPNENSGTSSGDTLIKGTAVPLSAMTDALSHTLGRPVVDKTGLTGTFDYDLKWAREGSPEAAGAGGTTEDAPPLFTAIQEQLGLKLQPGKDPVQVLVVESISQPTEN